LIYLFTFKSAKSVGKVVLVTATLPFLTLIVLAIRGVTLPGAMEGLKFLFTFNKDLFFSWELWKAAAGQIFFTLSLAMGIMIAYGALKKPESEIVQSTVLVALGNTLISFLSAIAVFSTLGYLALKTGKPITDVVNA
jgi:NSS family neurotransmitter:Na+ symporter